MTTLSYNMGDANISVDVYANYTDYSVDELLKKQDAYLAYRNIQDSIEGDRDTFRYFYYTLSPLIVISNAIMITAICASKKQRKHFRNWLILHMTIIHLLIGGVSCPFIAQTLVILNGGLGIAACKALYFLTDAFNYMSNVTIVLLGIYQCLNMCSPRMLKGVSKALLCAIMIVIPWMVVVLLTSVLRLTMSEEHFGMCYEIADETAQVVWIILAHGVPLCLIFVCLVVVVVLACTTTSVRIDNSPPGRQNITLFVLACLISAFVMRPPFYFLHHEPIYAQCALEKGQIICHRLRLTFDQIRLVNIIFIPLVYLIPDELRKGCRKIRFTMRKTADCGSKTKKMNMELTDTKSCERTLMRERVVT